MDTETVKDILFIGGAFIATPFAVVKLFRDARDILFPPSAWKGRDPFDIPELTYLRKQNDKDLTKLRRRLAAVLKAEGLH